MPSCGDNLRTVCHLINRYETYTESAGCTRFGSLIARSDVSNAVKITSVAAVKRVFPRTFGLLDDTTIAERAIVVDNERFGCDVEAHRSSCWGIVGILNKFIRQRAVALKIS